MFGKAGYFHGKVASGDKMQGSLAKDQSEFEFHQDTVLTTQGKCDGLPSRGRKGRGGRMSL